MYVGLFALIALFGFYKKNFNYWKNKNVKMTNPWFPMGDIFQAGFYKNFGIVLKEIYDKFPGEKFNGCWVFYRPHLMIRDPELIKTIFDKFIFHPLITNDNDNDNNDGRKESIDKFYKMAKKICLTYSTLTISWVLSIILSPILKWLWTVTFTDTKANDLPFPQILPGYFPVDHTKIPQGPICYFMQTFTSTVVCIMYVATDTLWCFIIFLTMGQYNFLKVSIKSIGEYINDGRKSEEEGGEGGVEEDCMPLEKNKMIQVEMKLKKCLKFHGFLTE